MPNLEEVFNFVVVAVVAGGVLLLLFSPFLIAALRDTRTDEEKWVDEELRKQRKKRGR